jgi:serine/threonine protein kinase
LLPGQQVDDFEVLRVLGKGAFGTVYLARQISLDRQVALKVTDQRGDEGRNMAPLEHEHIVQVFSETLDDCGHRLLCMRYVPGPTLNAVLEELRQQGRAQWNGAAVLEIIDRLTPEPAAFDPGALRDRELLRQSDWMGTACWIGARLAEALAYAHGRGVVHRDIKPANILCTQYGRPMLVDFNLAARPRKLAPGAAEIFGGTLAYMSPEHLEAFSSDEAASRHSIAESSDIYALGVVLYEMLCGELPFPLPKSKGSAREAVRTMAAERRAAVPSLPPDYPRVLDESVRRCLAPDAEQRWRSGTELSAALEGCREYHSATKTVPSLSHLERLLGRRPFLGMVLLALVPAVIATIVNIAYNHIRIISHLTAEQQTVFMRLVPIYNSIVYAIGLTLALRVVLPVYRAWQQPRGAPDGASRIDAARAQALAWPLWAAGLPCIGWVPGAVVFPAVLSLFGPMTWHVVLHLFISFLLSGMISISYGFLVIQCVVVCFFYPRLWLDARNFHQTAAVELAPVAGWLRVAQVLCALIPLAGAILMVGIGPAPAEYHLFRALVAALIALGMLGFHLAMRSTRLLSSAVSALGGKASARSAAPLACRQ